MIGIKKAIQTTNVLNCYEILGKVYQTILFLAFIFCLLAKSFNLLYFYLI